MRKCVEKKVVPRKDGGTQTVCAKYDTGADVIQVEGGKENIGVFNVQTISGLAPTVPEIVPPVIGMGAAAAATLLLKKFTNNVTIYQWSEAIGGVLGAIACVPLKWWDAAGGDSAAKAGMISAILFGTYTQVTNNIGPWLLGFPPTESTQGLGLLTAQPTGALAMQQVGALPAAASNISNKMPESIQKQTQTKVFGNKFGKVF